VGLGVGVTVCVGVIVCVGVKLGAVGLGVRVCVAVGTSVGVAVRVGVLVGARVRVAVGELVADDTSAICVVRARSAAGTVGSLVRVGEGLAVGGAGVAVAVSPAGVDEGRVPQPASSSMPNTNTSRMAMTRAGLPVGRELSTDIACLTFPHRSY
jgi:hypothetical protein